MKPRVAVIFGAAAALGVLAALHWSSPGPVPAPLPASLDESPAPEASADVSQALAPPRPAAPLPARAGAVVPAGFAASALAEPEIMSELRELGDGSPEYSLAIARQGNARFPNSPDAAERAWYVCKS